MRIPAKYLIAGPVIYSNDPPIRHLHLIDPDRDGTICGRKPKSKKNDSLSRRWIPMTQNSKIKCETVDCEICSRFTLQYVGNDRLDIYECLD